MPRVWLLAWSLLFFFVIPGSAQADDTSCSPEPSAVELSDSVKTVSLFAGQSTLFKLRENMPETTVWYLNGVAVQATENSTYCLSIPSAGQHTLEVKRAFDSSYFSTKIEVVSYKNIQLVSITPKMSDEAQESFTLFNHNPFFVHLKNWSLRSHTSKTRISIDRVIDPNASVAITTTNKLRNTGGSYGLYDESDRLVDVVNYTSAEVGETLQRDSSLWDEDEANSSQTNKENPDDKTDTEVEVKGLVILPNGRTIDVQNDAGELIRIVLHSSFKGEKPRLEKGDVVSANGIWKRSKRGWYISVREGHSFALLHEFRRQTLQKKQDTLSGGSVSQTAPQALKTDNLEKSMIPLVIGSMNQPLTSPTLIWWNLTLIILLSSGIALPFRREKTI